MSIDCNWSFKDLIFNVERLKKEYIFFLAFFSLNNDIESKRKQNKYIKSIRDKFYNINIEERQIDKAWEYMNDYICYFDLIHYFNQFENKRKK